MRRAARPRETEPTRPAGQLYLLATPAARLLLRATRDVLHDPKVSQIFKANNSPKAQKWCDQRQLAGAFAGETVRSAPSPQTPRQRPQPKLLTSSRGRLLGWAPRSPLMGTGGPRAVGPRRPPTLPATTPQAHPVCQKVAPVAAAASRCSGDPTCSKVPGEKSQGFPSGRSCREEARRGGI